MNMRVLYNEITFWLQRKRRVLRKKGGKGKGKGDKGKHDDKGDDGSNLLFSICNMIDHVNITVSLICNKFLNIIEVH